MAGDVAVTSLSVMAFLAKGNTPGRGPYGEVVNKGVDFVLASQDANGMIVGKGSAGPMYCHCMASLMLSEVSGMVDRSRQAKIDTVLPKAISLILAAQQVKKAPEMQGGWRYTPVYPDSDISCSGWPLMALRSARNNGSPVPKQAIENAVKFLLNCRMPERRLCLPAARRFGSGPHGRSGLLGLKSADTTATSPPSARATGSSRTCPNISARVTSTTPSTTPARECSNWAETTGTPTPSTCTR